ncbi:MAG: hypothetical protein LBT14_03285 [Treponema sp.]|jgi:hypothetical protein|nr:hypothetical protein [Treponema sp.]
MEMRPYADLQYIITASPFTEEFTVNPAGESFTIRGIFDESVLIDDGNSRKTTRPIPRIILYEVPEYESGKTEIVVRGKTYRAQKHEVDANIGVVLFLI